MKENNLPNPPFPVDVDAWRLWLDLGRRDAAAADKLYFDHFLTAHIAYLRTKSDPTRGASSLVTLIGFSPMVSAIVAGLLRPSSVVAIGGAEAAPSVALLRGFLSSGCCRWKSGIRLSKRFRDVGDQRILREGADYPDAAQIVGGGSGGGCAEDEPDGGHGSGRWKHYLGDEGGCAAGGADDADHAANSEGWTV